MEKDDKLKRYSRKDYSDVVDFPVELIDRDGVVRRYSFEESLEVYQRRIQTASWRYEDAELVAAEIDHCTKRLHQIERSFLLRHQGEAAQLARPEVQAATGLAEADTVLQAFYKAALGEEGLRVPEDQELPLTVMPLASDGTPSVWMVRFGTLDEHHLLYVYPWSDPASPALYEEWVRTLRRVAFLQGTAAEHLLLDTDWPQAGYVLTGTEAVPEIIRAGAEPRLWPGEEEEEGGHFWLDDSSRLLPDPEDGEGGNQEEWDSGASIEKGSQVFGQEEAEKERTEERSSLEGKGPGEEEMGFPENSDFDFEPSSSEFDEEEEEEEGESAHPPLLPGEGREASVSPSDEAFAEGALALRSGDPQGAAEAMRVAVERNPWHREAYRVLISLLDAAGRMEEAELYALMAGSYLPDDPIIVHHRALLHLRRGERDDALAGFEKALAMDGSFHHARYFAGLVHASEGRLAEASRLLRQAGEDDILRPRVEVALSWVARQQALLRRSHLLILLLVALSALALSLGSPGVAMAGSVVSGLALLLVRPFLGSRVGTVYQRLLAAQPQPSSGNP